MKDEERRREKKGYEIYTSDTILSYGEHYIIH